MPKWWLEGVFGMPMRYRKNQNRDALKQARYRACMQDKGFGVLLGFENQRAFCWVSRARAFKNYQEVCIGLRKLPQVVCAPQFCAVAETAMSGGFQRLLS